MAQIDADNREAVELTQTYRRVFNTPDGLVVLEDLLSDLHYHDTVASMGDATLHNAAKIILFKLGVLQDHNLKGMLESFMKLPYLPPVKGDKEN